MNMSPCCRNWEYSVFLLLISGWYNHQQSKQEQHKSKFVSAYGLKGQQKNIQRASEASNQHFFQRQSVSNELPR